MKIIDVQKPLEVKFQTTQGEKVEEVKFKDFLVNHLDAYSADWAKSLQQLRQINEIVKIVEAGNGTITFERNDDWEVYEAALKIPRYKGHPGRQLLPFYEAALKAQDVTK